MKAILTSVLALTAITAAAEGYQVNTLSARQGGMAHTGTALKLGAQSAFFNPAGMAFLNGNAEINASINAVMATAKCITPQGTSTTDNNPSTPMMATAAFSIYDNLKGGLAFYTPYGSSINWGQSWQGAVLNQSVDLKAYTLQPTLAWQIIPGLSIGAGLTLSWGDVDLSKGLVSPATMDKLVSMLKTFGQLPEATPPFGQTMPASIQLNGNSRLAVGFNAGIMYDITPQWTVGASYRSKSTLRVKAGDASLSYANQVAQAVLESELGVIDRANFAAEMPLPAVVNIGVAWRPSKPWLVTAEAQCTKWSAYKTLDIEFLDPTVSKYDQHITKDYHDAWAFRAGAQWSVTDRLDLRGGCTVDLTPVNKQHYNPETPGMTKISPSLGLTLRPVGGLAIDLAALYVAGTGADNVSCTYPDLLAAKLNQMVPPAVQLPLQQTFTADYRVHAWVLSLGVGYSF